MTFSQEDKQRLIKALGFWLAGFALVAGWMYYHSTVPIGPVLLAGLLTLIITLYRSLKKT